VFSGAHRVIRSATLCELAQMTEMREAVSRSRVMAPPQARSAPDRPATGPRCRPRPLLRPDAAIMLGAGLNLGVDAEAQLKRTARVVGATAPGDEADHVSTAGQTTEEAS
jgi:hypothetical protein